MPVRNVYTLEENEAINEFLARRDSYMGWVGEALTPNYQNPVAHRTISRPVMLQMASAVDPKNPLWRDDAYARGTRWGRIIGVPFLAERVAHGGGGMIALKAPEGVYVERWFPGTYWEFFAPIREGDSFKVWRSRPELMDLTETSGNGPRKFRIASTKSRYFNQKDELVATFAHYFDETWHRKIGDNSVPPHRYPDFTVGLRSDEQQVIPPDYVYSQQELAFITRLAGEEEIRGAKIRWWEDVQAGEELRPVTTGPYTLRELAIDFASTAGPLHMRQGTRLGGDPKGFMGSPACESFMGRLVTNWMGDDGFIRRFRWFMMEHFHLGDTLIGRGKVLKTYVENGEHLVDLSLWTECIGEEQTVHAGLVTVKLLSKEDM